MTISHATYVFTTYTLCGRPAASVTVRQHGSMGWQYTTCQSCQEEIENHKNLDRRELEVSRRLDF